MAAGRREAAERLWRRATGVQPGGAAATAAAAAGTSAVPQIGWPSVLQVPTIWLPGLRSTPLWDCGHWPFALRLERGAARILEEVRAAEHHFEAAYPYLSQRGRWENLFLVRGHRWDAALCAALPWTCQQLLPELPTKPGVPFTSKNNEEVVIFRSNRGTSVGAHCGASNNQVNIHLTLTGAGGTTLRVGDEEVPLRDGRAVCFQDSYFHSVEHRGASERISLVVRVMHPEMSLATYDGLARTDAVDLAEWRATAALSKEVERLRCEYRRRVQGDGEAPAGGDASSAAAAVAAAAGQAPCWSLGAPSSPEEACDAVA